MTKMSFIFILALVGCEPRSQKLCKQIAAKLEESSVHCQPERIQGNAFTGASMSRFGSADAHGVCAVIVFDSDKDAPIWMAVQTEGVVHAYDAGTRTVVVCKLTWAKSTMAWMQWAIEP
jgi:hypothetical protein